jgi:hypothetical protein
MSAAVDATWGTLATKGGRIFATYYNAGTPGEACGANVNGWRMYQWGSQACGLAGRSAADILRTYYAGVMVSAAPAPAPPPPTPAPTPTPTPTPAATPGPPAATVTPQPTPAPTPTPVPVPPAMPGGGQSGLAAPPPPPPPNPVPVVVTLAQAAAPAPSVDAAPTHAPRDLPDGHRTLTFERDADAQAARATWSAQAGLRSSSRWATVRVLVAGLVATWADGWSGALGQQPRDGQLGGGDILDREADRLEDGDRLGVALLGRRSRDAADLDQAPLLD